MVKRSFVRAGAAWFFLAATAAVWCQNLQLERNKATVLVEPYAANIGRVSVSLLKEERWPPRLVCFAKASSEGWTV